MLPGKMTRELCINWPTYFLNLCYSLPFVISLSSLCRHVTCDMLQRHILCMSMYIAVHELILDFILLSLLASVSFS